VSLALRRDLRLDFFRGLALVSIFIDHTPGNLLASFTLRNFGLSDASELFVFISAYTAGLVYMSRMLRDGPAAATRRIWRRAAQIYVAHLLVLVVTCFLAGWLTDALDNPQFVNGLNVAPFLERPAPVFLEALLLRFQPTFMNILPLYVVLFVVLPFVLWLLRRSRVLALGLSAALYIVAREAVWTESPFAAWQFNPLAWQFLFVIGVVLGSSAAGGSRVPRSHAMLVLAVAYLVWGLGTGGAAWSYDGSSLSLPPWLRSLLFPVMDRPNLSPWRLLHVLALAYVAMTVMRGSSPFLRSRVARPLVLIGQHSLTVFSVGVILSVLAWAVLTGLGDPLPVQALVNVGGVFVMGVIAWLLLRRGRQPMPNSHGLQPDAP
jgi:hypothetical protein